MRLQNVIEVVNKLRPFEKKRLMDMAPYQAVAKRLAFDATEVTEITEVTDGETPDVAMAPDVADL